MAECTHNSRGVQIVCHLILLCSTSQSSPGTSRVYLDRGKQEWFPCRRQNEQVLRCLPLTQL